MTAYPFLAWLLALPLILLAASGAHAGTARLDDSASPRQRVAPVTVLTLEGRPFDSVVEGPAPTHAVLKYGRVDYKLATGRYMGQRARIYFVIPALIPSLRSPAGLQVEWRGHGQFASGSARPGDRVLVWSGVVPGPWMSEGLDLTLQLDLRELQRSDNGSFPFESYFEIEVHP